MPTESLKSLLDRDLSRVAAMEVIENDSALLREIVNYATNAWARCADSAKGNENEDVAVTSLYYHIIEMTDGIDVLISQQCTVPAIPLLRSSFEANLSLRYILQDRYVERSLAWLAHDIRRRIGIYEALDPSTERGKQAQAINNADHVAKSIDFSDIGPTKENADRLRRLLDKKQFRPVVQEIENLRTRGERSPKWFRLFGGPRTLFELAQRLKEGAHYEILYRYWSEVAHATSVERIIAPDKSGSFGVRRMRDPNDTGQIASMAASFLLEATRRMLLRFRPGEEGNLKTWYIVEVQARNRIALERSAAK